jgi:putative phosphoesterase
LIIGILSDTHLAAPDERLERLLAVTLADAEVLLHAGDHTGDAVIEYLQYDEPRPYYGVAGNMDLGRQGQSLPARRLVRVAGLTIGLIHGWGAPTGLEQRVLSAFDPAVDVVVYGHSHHPGARRVDGRCLLNPGSAFHPRGPGRGSVAVLLAGGDRPAVEFREVAGGHG